MSQRDDESRRYGKAIRGLRLLQNMTQEEVCRKARIGLSTLYKIETGIRSRASTYRKVCDALQTNPAELLRQEAMEKTKERLAVVHRASEATWYAPIDQRRIVPDENSVLIQDPSERHRLGRLGLVPLFACYPNLLMPAGPGATLLELFGRYPSSFNSTVYREALLYCLSSSVRLQVGEAVYVLHEGDILGYTNPELRWIEPVETVSIPARLIWVGAVRCGKIADRSRRMLVRKHR